MNDVRQNYLTVACGKRARHEALAINITKRKDVVSVIDLSKLLSQHYDLSSAEACEWITKVIIREHPIIFNTTGSGLIEKFPPEKGIDIAVEVFNRAWWNRTEISFTPMCGCNGVSENDVALLKLDAYTFFGVTEDVIQEVEKKTKAGKRTNQIKEPEPNKNIKIKLTDDKEIAKRLKCLQDFSNYLRTIEGVDVFTIPMTKKQILEQLQKKYPEDNLWDIGIESFHKMWKAKGSGNICGVKTPTNKKGEYFIKKYLR